MKKKTTIDLLVLIAILIFVNLISITVFKRFDLSRGKIYSLSISSKTTVKDLDDRLIIKAYFSKNMPGEYADSRRFVQDILSEYQAYSHGNLKFEFLDPADEQELKKEAQQNGIMPVSMRVVENDKLEIREVYMGLVFMYQDKIESLPMIKNTQGLEYDVTGKIKKITANGLKKIAIYDPDKTESQQIPGNPAVNDKYVSIVQFLSESYEVSKTDLTQPVEENVDALIIAGIADSLEMSQLVNIDQFLMSDGNIILFQDRINANIQQMSATPINSNLFRLLSTYGISIKPNLITDAQCGKVTIQQQRGIFRTQIPVNYPFFPIINNVNKDNILVQKLDYMQLIFASEIDTANLSENVIFEPLLYTSENSGVVTMPQLDISYQPYMNVNLKGMLIDEPKVVAGIYSGKFVSNFMDHTKENEDAVGSTETGKILLVSDSEFIQEGAGAGVPGNRDFVLNAVDYMVSEGALIEIRSRETQFTPLKDVKSGTKKLIRWINILLPSLLLILLGMIHYRKELKRRKHIGELYE